jgi:hypothetical protein
MMNFKRGCWAPVTVLLSVVLASCGGNAPGSDSTSSTGGSSGTGSTTTTAANVVPVTVDAGPTGVNATNSLFTTVTVCVPGSTTECQTIDNIQVDTGSYGLRILASVLTLTLPTATAADGNSLLECTQFVDGYSWGPVATAGVQISGESASNVPIQVIGSSTFTNVPADCSSSGPAENTVTSFGANGILGIGVFAQDCGSGCASAPLAGTYYSCTATTCNAIAVPLISQVPNPVTLFATDNNGTIIELPSVPAAGAATLTGSLIFGIDTETNNASGTGKTVLTLDSTFGTFSTAFDGTTFGSSFIDSGSNGLFFYDTAIPQCSSSDYSGFDCPSSTLSLSATLTGDNNVSAAVSFSIANAQTLFEAEPTYTAFASLGGTYSGTTTFDWGLPFFYGRDVYNAIQGYSTSAGAGPYVAF